MLRGSTACSKRTHIVLWLLGYRGYLNGSARPLHNQVPNNAEFRITSSNGHAWLQQNAGAMVGSENLNCAYEKSMITLLAKA